MVIEKTSENDLMVGEPKEWWVAMNREYNAYFHIPCKEHWEDQLVILDPKYAEPKCPHCEAGIPEAEVMLILLQRMNGNLPGAQES